MTNDIRTLRILLVDDHMVVRKGLMHVLDNVSDMEVIGEAENGEEALFLAQKHHPDVIIMDVKMEGLGGVEATRLIMQYLPEAKVIGLSTFAHADIIKDMYAAGAKGYLLKDISGEDLADGIRRVSQGEMLPLPQIQDQTTISRTQPQNDESEAEPLIGALGEQQKRVLALMTKGFTNPEIADHLGISAPTARYHVSAILRKLDVSNRSEAVAMAIRLDLVRAEDF